MTLRATLPLIALLLIAPSEASAREWSDDSGSYTIEAELIAFDDDRVILQRGADGELGSVPIERLSAADQEYLASEEAKDHAAKFAAKQQVWHLRSGLKVPGRVVDYTRREVTFKRQRGKVYVNGRTFDNLPEIYQKIAPQIVAEYEGNRVSDKRTLESWLTHRRGEPQTYTVDGVVLELASGDEYALPFFLFSEEDLRVLQPGWEDWLAAEEVYDTRQDTSFELQSLAAAYKEDAQSRRQIAELQLGMQAVEAGVTALWEVTLYPAQGTPGGPLWVMAPGRDSRAAMQNALANNPGYVAGPTRRLSNRRR